MGGFLSKKGERMHKGTNGLLSAQEISKKYKVAYPTINHYTDLGFLHIVRRDGNRRLYSDRHVRSRLTQISKLVNEGYPLRLIRKKLS